MRTHALTINSLRHTCYTWGNPKKPSLFLIHGWMDTGASFDFVCRYLQKDFYCIAPDLRGFGRSAHTPNPLGYFFYEYIADLHQLFQKFSSDQPVNVLGHSMGGNILSFYAGSFPERISRFINIEGFGIFDMPPELGPERIRKWIEGLGSPRFKIYANFKELAQRLNEANSHLSAEQALFLAKQMGKKVKGGVILASDPKHKLPHPYLFQMKNFEAFLKKIEAHCLLIAAEKTQMDEWMKAGRDVMEEIKRRMDFFPPSSQKVILPYCGHMVHQEQPEELARLVGDFLKS